MYMCKPLNLLLTPNSCSLHSPFHSTPTPTGPHSAVSDKAGETMKFVFKPILSNIGVWILVLPVSVSFSKLFFRVYVGPTYSSTETKAQIAQVVLLWWSWWVEYCWWCGLSELIKLSYKNVHYQPFTSLLTDIIMISNLPLVDAPLGGTLESVFCSQSIQQ